MEQAAGVRRTALLAATMASFLTPFMGSALNIALPSIGKEWDIGTVLLGWISTVYLLSSATCLVPLGKLADLRGRKRIFTGGVALYGFTSLLCGLAPSVGWLMAFRVLQGVGGAMIFGTGVAILSSVFPPRERGQALGINVASVYLGLSLGPPLGGLLTRYWGWRSIFLAQVPLVLAILALVRRKLRGEWRGETKGPFDGVGASLYGMALVVLIYGFSRLSTALGAWLTLAGLLGLGMFALWEHRAPNPILDLRLLRGNKVFAFSNLAALINYSATAAVGFLLSLYLQNVKGLPPDRAGFVLLAQPMVQALFSPLAGRASDRIEPRIVASTGMGLTVMGLALLPRLAPETDLPFVVAVLMLLGLGFALFSSPNTNAVMGSVEPRFYGVASATLATMRLTGQMLSMGIVMLFLTLFLGGGKVTPENIPLFLRSARAAFALFALLCTGGVFASLARGELRQAPLTPSAGDTPQGSR